MRRERKRRGEGRGGRERGKGVAGPVEPPSPGVQV